jgi:toxin ParE1/3/4
MRVFWTEPSEADLDGLVEHVAQDTVSGALTMDARIRDEARRLADFPESGRLGKFAGTRELVIPRYRCVLVYRLKDGQVQILRLIHGGQEWPDAV